MELLTTGRVRFKQARTVAVYHKDLHLQDPLITMYRTQRAMEILLPGSGRGGRRGSYPSPRLFCQRYSR